MRGYLDLGDALLLVPVGSRPFVAASSVPCPRRTARRPHRGWAIPTSPTSERALIDDQALARVLRGDCPAPLARRDLATIGEVPAEIELVSLRRLGPAIGRLRERHSLNLLAGEAWLPPTTSAPTSSCPPRRRGWSRRSPSRLAWRLDAPHVTAGRHYAPLRSGTDVARRKQRATAQWPPHPSDAAVCGGRDRRRSRDSALFRRAGPDFGRTAHQRVRRENAAHSEFLASGECPAGTASDRGVPVLLARIWHEIDTRDRGAAAARRAGPNTGQSVPWRAFERRALATPRSAIADSAGRRRGEGCRRRTRRRERE